MSKVGKSSVVVAAVVLVALAFSLTALGHPSRKSATTRNTVNMTEFKFALTPKTARKGTVIFTVVNKGDVAHDFKIAGKKTPSVAANKRSTLRVTFKSAGRYPYVCTLPGHAPAGMKGVLVVK